MKPCVKYLSIDEARGLVIHGKVLVERLLSEEADGEVIRLTLYPTEGPGTSAEWGTSSQTDEGHAACSEQIDQADGRWLAEWASWGRDADGPYRHYGQAESKGGPYGPDDGYPAHADRSAWQPITSSQYDAFAEAAGY